MTGSFADAFRRAGVSAVGLIHGSVCLIKDELIAFPEERLPKAKRTKHPIRTVLVLSCDEDCKDPFRHSVLVAPISSSINKARTDFPVGAGARGLARNSFVRLGHIQPALKVDIKATLGMLDDEMMAQIHAVIMANLGIISRPP